MAWYNTRGEDLDVVLSTRVRLARNLEGLPFDLSGDDARAAELTQQVRAQLLPTGYREIDFRTLSDEEAASYVEKHLCSREFADKRGVRSLFCNDTSTVAVMVGEEDHLRIQAILPGFASEAALEAARACDSLLSALPYAYDETLGYLTHCPTNLGTAMRVSAMLFLPALQKAGKMEQLSEQLGKLGLTIRGLFGEGSSSRAGLYQISNTTALGLSEDELLKKTRETLQQIIELERKLRTEQQKVAGDRLADRCGRALGQLRYARLLSSAELLQLLSDVRLGTALSLFDEGQAPDPVTLSRLLVSAMPATLTLQEKAAGRPCEGDTDRDRARATLARTQLA